MALVKYVPSIRNIDEAGSLSDLSRQVNQIQNEYAKAVNAITSNPFLFGSGPFSVTVPTVGTVDINHTLGRIPMGFIVVDITTEGSVFASARSTTTLTLSNTGAADVTLKVWVY